MGGGGIHSGGTAKSIAAHPQSQGKMPGRPWRVKGRTGRTPTQSSRSMPGHPLIDAEGAAAIHSHLPAEGAAVDAQGKRDIFRFRFFFFK